MSDAGDRKHPLSPPRSGHEKVEKVPNWRETSTCVPRVDKNKDVLVQIEETIKSGKWVPRTGGSSEWIKLVNDAHTAAGPIPYPAQDPGPEPHLPLGHLLIKLATPPADPGPNIGSILTLGANWPYGPKRGVVFDETVEVAGGSGEMAEKAGDVVEDV